MLMNWLTWDTLSITAWPLLAVSVLIAAWALFWDRSRGRRRCPKCWYDMAGVPGLRCPECGREAKHEKRLRKTRRHWRRLAVAVILLLAAAGIMRAIATRERGWPAAVPTTLLLLSMNWLEPSTSFPTTPGGAPAAAKHRLYDELVNSRLRNGELARWQERWLLERCMAGDRKRPLGSEAWRWSYSFILQEAVFGAESARRPLDEGEYRGPWEVDCSDGFLHRMREALLIGSIHTRTVWPLGTPIHAQINPYALAGEDHRLLILDTDLDEPRSTQMDIVGFGTSVCVMGPPMWSDDASTLGTSHIERRDVPIRYRLVSRPWFTGPEAKQDELIQEGTIWRPMEIRGSIDEIMQPFACERIAETLQQLRPRGSYSRFTDGAVDLYLFDTTRAPPGACSEEDLASALSSHDGATLGMQLELLRDGEVIAAGAAWLRPRTSGNAGLEPSHYGIALPPADTPPPNGTHGTWILRITGCPHIALRSFESTRYWKGTVEIPLEMTDP